MVVAVDHKVNAVLIKDRLPDPPLFGDAPGGMTAEERMVKEHNGPLLILVGLEVFYQPFCLRLTQLERCVSGVAVERDNVGIGVIKCVIHTSVFVGNGGVVVIVVGVLFVIAQAGVDGHVFGQSAHGVEILGFPLLIDLAAGDQVTRI